MIGNFWTDHADVLADAYTRAAGTMRFELVTRALLMHMPSGPQRVVDVGGGFGLQAIMLARAGHSVVVLDIDPQMLAIAEEKLGREPKGVSSRVKLVLGDGKSAASLVGTNFDMVCCHSVLMYEDDCVPMLTGLVGLARPRGLISVLCINKDSYAMRSGLQLRWREAEAILKGKETDSQCMPSRKQTRAEVEEVLKAAGARVREWQGIGVFTDHLTEKIAAEETEHVFQVEWLAGLRDPYRQVARCFHTIAERT